MDFGLGLILSFTDNATTGINSAVGSLGLLESTAQQASASMENLSNTASLSALSVVSGQLGSSLTNMGSSIMGTFSNVINSIMNTGSEFQSLRITLNALMKDSDKAEEALDNLINFASTTPFEINDLTGIFTTITANGVDAFKTITSASSDMQTNVLSAIGDLMALRPDVPAQQWGVAIRNAFSGEVRSLKNALDLNVNDILGRKWGASGDIAQDFVDLADKVGVLGLMGSNMGTLNQSLANVSDQFTRIRKEIADSGVFDQLQSAIVNVTSAIGEIRGENLDALVSSIGGALQFVLNPLTQVTKKIASMIGGISKFIGQHPKLTKVLVTLTAFTGVALIMAGTVLKATSALSGLCLLMLTLKQFSGLGGIFASGFASILSVVVPLAIAISTLALAWKNDFGGMKTETLKFVDGVVNSFVTAKNAVNGSVKDMRKTISELDQSTFFGGLTIAIMRVWILFRAVAESWNDYTLSENTFKKAKELGILPLIEGILNLKYKFENFKKGFTDGWTEIGNRVKDIVSQLKSSLDGTIFETIYDKAKEFFGSITTSDADKWYEIGKAVGKFGTLALGAFLGLKVIGGIMSIAFSPVLGIIALLLTGFSSLLGFSSLGSFFSTIFGGINKGTIGLVNVLPTIFKFLGNIIANVFNFLPLLGTFFGDIVGIFTHFGGLSGGLAYIFKDLIFGGILDVITSIPSLSKFLFTALASLFLAFPKVLTFLPNMLNVVYGLIVEGIETFLPALMPVFTRFLPSLFGKVGGMISRLLGSSLVTGIGGVLSKAFGAIGAIAPYIATGIGKIGGLIVSVLTTTIGGVPIALILAVVAGITAVVALLSNNSGTIKDAFMKLWDKLPTGVQDALIGIGSLISDFFVGITDRLGITDDLAKFGDVFMNVILPKIVAFGNGVISTVKVIWGWLSNIFNGFIVPVFQTLITAIKNIWNGGFGELLGNLVMIMGGIIAGIKVAIDWCLTYILPIAKDIVVGIINTISPLISGISKIINGVIQYFKGMIMFFKGIFTGDLSTAWEGITNIFGGAWKVITGIFEGVGGFFKGVVETIWNIFKDIGTVIADTITGIIKTAINAVLGTACALVNGFVKAINGAIGLINKIPGVEIAKLSEVSLPKFAEGGVVSKPTLGVFGEAGTEAVVPLENNTGWISKVAGDLASKLNTGASVDLSPLISTLGDFVNTISNVISAPIYSVPEQQDTRPVVTSMATPTASASNSYMTSNNNNVTHEGDTDNSIVFEQGSVVVNVASAEKEDLERVAERLMEIIERKKRIRQRLRYS